MAGWSKLEDNSCMQRCNDTLKSNELKLQSYFIEMISGFLKGSYGNDCFRPLPPRLGNGDCVDLLKLYFVVKHKGGFESICEKNLWGEVGLQCGLDSSFGSAFKLVYIKYLNSFDSWLVKLDEENALQRKMLMELERNFAAFVSKIVDVKRGSDGSSSFKLEKSGVSVIDLTDEDDENDENDGKNESMKSKHDDVKMDLTNEGDENDGENESMKSKHHDVKMDLTDEYDENEGKNESMKSEHHNVKMCFVDSESSNEGNDESIDSKRHNIVMECASGLLDEKHIDEMSSIDGISSERSDNRMFSAGTAVGATSIASKKHSVGNDHEENMNNMGFGVLKEVSSNKRKRDYLSGMLQWMFNVAKDPTDPVIGEIPHCSKRELYGNDNKWKQALLARECLFEKRSRRSCAPQFGCQKKRKIYPSMFNHCETLSTSKAKSIYPCVSITYLNEANPLPPRQLSESLLDTQLLEAQPESQPTPSIHTIRPRRQQKNSVGSAELLEVSTSTSYHNEANSLPPRQLLEVRLDTQLLEARLESRPTPSTQTKRPRRQRQISVGSAEVPEWTGVAVESDPKWLGTRTWPLENTKSRLFVDTDLIGKGRMDNCDCQFPGSIECVKFHVSKSRMKMRLELRSAFYAWNFDKMGEDCSASWAIEEERKFKRLVRENRKTSQRCLWEPVCKALPQKRWADQINYYYSVFMLRRRGYQNRHYPSDIDSDDDETEYRSTNNSIRHGSA